MGRKGKLKRERRAAVLADLRADIERCAAMEATGRCPLRATWEFELVAGTAGIDRNGKSIEHEGEETTSRACDKHTTDLGLLGRIKRQRPLEVAPIVHETAKVPEKPAEPEKIEPRSVKAFLLSARVRRAKRYQERAEELLKNKRPRSGSVGGIRTTSRHAEAPAPKNA